MPIEKAETSTNIFLELVETVQAHPITAICVLIAVTIVLCFLPNGVITAAIAHRTEMRKLDERVNISRKKLTSGRQNRRPKR